MAEFLLELLSEEIPAGMQEWARKELEESVCYRLDDEGVSNNSASVFSTPRRLILVIEDIELTSKEDTEETKGPRVDAPQQAIDGFCDSRGVDVEDLLIQEDKKGKFYVLQTKEEGRNTEDILAEILPNIINKFNWPKSMRWGDSDFRWVRPLHSILAIFDDKLVSFEVGGIKSGNETRGNLFDSTPIKINSYDDYRDKLDKAGIIFSEEDRYEKILSDAGSMCDAERLELIEDEELLNEITGLVESPMCIIGEINSKFLSLPDEVLQTSMKTHQKFLSLENPITHRVEYFITVANRTTWKGADGILKGNQRVLSARLADALFFWENDLRIAKAGMKSWTDKLQKITFHNKLGTQADRVNRIAEFAKSHAKLFNISAEDAVKTPHLIKLDLCSEMVGELPELQGIMGYYYAKEAKYNSEIANACKEHYSPLGLKDTTPTASLSVLMALADKLDTLAGFWAVGIIPTSSKDPFALRRAALGVIRLILDNNLRLSLTDLLNSAFKPFPKKDEQAQTKLMDFFHERLKIYLRDKHDIPADTIDACRFGQGETDFALLTNRAKALHAFRPDAEFQNLLQGFKRAHNILHAEQKKDGVFFEMPPEPQYFQDPTETELHTALNAAETALPPLMQKEQFAQMLQTLANLRAPIDAFFTQVQVNSDQSAVRRNRLCLLHKLCSVMKTFADFSRLNG